MLKEIILTETNDLSYFNKSIHLLKSLEKVAYARNERLRIYHEKIRSIRAIVAGMLASILSTAIWIFIMLSLELSYFDLQTTGKFVTRLVALLLTITLLIILPYLCLYKMWRHPLFRSFTSILEKKVLKQLFTDIEKIDEKAYQIVSQPAFRNPRVPDHYLTVEHLIKLEKYMASGEAKTISEALDYLKNELETKIYFSNLETYQTLLQREKNYLKNVNQNLINRIKKEEEVYG